MSALFALLLAQAATAATPAPAPAPAEADTPVKREILAIAARMQGWKGGIYKDAERLACRIEQSSGDADVDAIRCGAMVVCYSPKVVEMDAIAASELPEADRTRKMAAIAASTKPCLEAAHVRGAVKLAQHRTTKK